MLLKTHYFISLKSDFPTKFDPTGGGVVSCCPPPSVLALKVPYVYQRKTYGYFIRRFGGPIGLTDEMLAKRRTNGTGNICKKRLIDRTIFGQLDS